MAKVYTITPLLFVLLVVQCMGPRIDHLIRYDNFSFQYDDFEFRGVLNGEYSYPDHYLYEQAIYGNPYHLSIILSSEHEIEQYSSYLVSMILTGQEDKIVYAQQDTALIGEQSDEHLDSGSYYVRWRYDNLSLPQQAYSLTVAIEICRAETCRVETISTQLNYHSTGGFGFVLIDKYMSI